MATPSQVRRRAQVRERLGIVYRTLLAILGLATVTVEALAATETWTDPPKTLRVALIVGLAVAATRDNVKIAWRRLFAPSVTRRRVAIQKYAVVALVAIADLRGVPVEDLGVNVWLVQKHFGGGQRLTRYLRFRIKDTPQQSEIDWTKGKGAIGECWEQGRPVHLHSAPAATKYGRRSIDEAAWSRVSERARQRFTREEFVTMVHKYAEVLAVPIKDEHGEFLGCMSVDLAMSSSHATTGNVLDGPGVEEVVATAAQLVAETLHRS